MVRHWVANLSSRIPHQDASWVNHPYWIPSGSAGIGEQGVIQGADSRSGACDHELDWT
jgi:hypothetical protein